MLFYNTSSCSNVNFEKELSHNHNYYKINSSPKVLHFLNLTCTNSTASPQVNTSIKWDHFVSNEEVLERANVLDMEIKLIKNRLRWMGHICRMNDTRPVKALLFGELEGSRKVGRPLLRYKDTCKMTLQRGKVLNEWIAVVNDRDKWKALIQNVCKEHNQKRKADYEERRQKRHKC